MAESVVYRITYYQDVPGQWEAITTIDLRYDPDLVGGGDDGVRVYANGGLVESGDPETGWQIPTSALPYKIETFYNPQICFNSDSISNALVTFARIQFYPFMIPGYLPDHPSCEFGGENCDLLVIGSPTVVGANEETADGSITVNASSSNAIQYRINDDFVYGDGMGQTSNVFSCLIAGTYRIYLRDSDNCGASVQVVVPTVNTYGVRYRMEYDDRIGGVTRIDILERAYAGDIEEICGGASPIEISMRGEGSRDKFEPMLASEAVLELMSMVDEQFITLYTNDREKYRVIFYKNESEKWIGKVRPQLYQAPYLAGPYAAITSATDGLAELKDYNLVQPDGQLFYGTTSLIKLLSFCLLKTGLELPIKVGVNLYAVEMDQTDDDDPFEQAHIDYECFYLSGDNPTLEYVVKEVLKPFGARIVQWDGYWNIVRVEEMINSYDYRLFDKNGEYVSNGTFDPVIDLAFPRDSAGGVMFSKRSQNLEIQPGYGLIKVLYPLGLKPNILRNGDFRLNAVLNPTTNQYEFQLNKDGWTLVNGGYPIAEQYEMIDSQTRDIAYVITGGSVDIPETGSAQIRSDAYTVKMGTNNQLKFKIRFKLPVIQFAAGSIAFTAVLPYIKVRMIVKLGNTAFLNNAGQWVLGDVFGIPPTELTFYETDFGQYVEKEIIAQYPDGFSGIDTTGLPLTVSVFHAYWAHADFLTESAFKAADTLTLGEGTRRTFRTDAYFTSEVYPDKLLYYELEENTSAEDIPNIIRPDDYLDDSGDPDHNPRQWILKTKVSITPYENVPITFWLDSVSAEFLTDGKEPIDTILRSRVAEKKNTDVLERNLIIGSYTDLVVTETYIDDRWSWAVPGADPIKVTVTTNALSAQLIYTGWLRDADGVGYENFARDGIAEADKLHGIFLTSHATQYNRAWSMIRASFISRDTYFGLLNVLREVNDDNKTYLPIGFTIRDKQVECEGEFLELIRALEGSDGGSSPFNSAFSVGFGQSGFN